MLSRQQQLLTDRQTDRRTSGYSGHIDTDRQTDRQASGYSGHTDTDRQTDKTGGHSGYADNDRQTYELVCAALSRQTRRQGQAGKSDTQILKDKHLLTDKPRDTRTTQILAD